MSEIEKQEAKGRKRNVQINIRISEAEAEQLRKQDGKILLADPNREENNTKAFEPSFIQQESKGYYIAVWK